MFDKEKIKKVKEKHQQWKDGTLKETMKKFKAEESHERFYSPLDIQGFDFLNDVGFPGQYPYTSGRYAMSVPGSGPVKGGGGIASGGGLKRAGRYSGYGTPEDTRDYYLNEKKRGRRSGPNVAFDLPTQCGYDSDSPLAAGEVGKVGVSIDTFKDFETLFEAFQGDMDIDKISSNFTINAPANIIIAMYAALAEKRGISPAKLRGTPQNDILKEFVARGTYIFPVRHSMRLVRDSITFCTEHMPLLNTVSICGFHMREAGATREQCLAFTFSNGIAYLSEGVNAGIDIDTCAARMTFLSFSGSMEILKEIALHRAARRMWAKIMRHRFGAKTPKNWAYRHVGGAMSGYYSTTAQRPLNNLTRAVLGGLAAALVGDNPSVEPPYDEPLGLGWSLEAQQLSEDAARIIQYEARLKDVIDPFAGSYFMEAMTNEIEEKAWEIIEKIDSMGGAVSAIEQGYMQQEIARSAHQFQKEIETGERIVVGVNSFLGEGELDVNTSRLVQHPYDPDKRVQAEEKQKKNLEQVKNSRDEKAVLSALREVKAAARAENRNTIPPIMEAVKAYATLGEICNVFREVFGEYQGYGSI